MKGPEFQEFIVWFFYAVLAAIATMMVKTLASIRDEMGSLNVKIAQLLERTEHHERVLDDHNDRIRSLEKI